MSDRWGVYRLYSFHGRLLYVGKGQNGARDRYREHKAKKWGRYIPTSALLELLRDRVDNRSETGDDHG